MLNKKNYYLVFLTILVIISFFLRFWKLPQLLYFMMDEGRDMFMMKRILVDHRPVLIGGSVPGGFNLGPGYYYLSAIVMFFGLYAKKCW